MCCASQTAGSCVAPSAARSHSHGSKHRQIVWCFLEQERCSTNSLARLLARARGSSTHLLLILAGLFGIFVLALSAREIVILADQLQECSTCGSVPTEEKVLQQDVCFDHIHGESYRLRYLPGAAGVSATLAIASCLRYYHLGLSPRVFLF